MAFISSAFTGVRVNSSQRAVCSRSAQWTMSEGKGGKGFGGGEATRE